MSASPPVTTPANQSNVKLASLLTEALADLDSARSERDAANRRAQRAENILAASGSPAANDSQQHRSAITNLQSITESQERTIGDLQLRLKTIADAWSSYDRWLASLEIRMTDARTAFGRALNAYVSTTDSSGDLSPLPLREIPPFQLPTLTRKSSRSTGALYHQHPSLQIPPGAPGGRPTSQAGVPSNLPPIPSGVVAGRVRPRDSSPRRASEDDANPPNSAPPDDSRPHRLLPDETEVIEQLSEPERRTKRMRTDSSGPGRRDRTHFSDSPQYPPHVPPNAHTGGPTPPPHAQSSSYSYPPSASLPNPNDPSSRNRSSDPAAHHPHAIPHHLHISEGRYAPRRESGSTIQSAITPTSAATVISGRSAGMSGHLVGTRDSISSTVYSHHGRGDERMNSLGDASVITTGPRVDSPPPIEPANPSGVAKQSRYHHSHGQDRQFASQSSIVFDPTSPGTDEEAQKRREKDKERQLSQRMRDADRRGAASKDAALEPDSMDLDREGDGNDPRLENQAQARIRPRTSSTTGRRLRTEDKREGGDDDDKNSVDEFLLTTAIDVPPYDEIDRDRARDDEERDELGDDRELSPMSRRSTGGPADSERERWRERDRERQGLVDLPGPQHTQVTGANGLIKVKERAGDKFRHYMYNTSGSGQSPPQQPQQTSPYLPPSHNPHHSQTYPPPSGAVGGMSATFSLIHGQLTQTRRGTIAGVVSPRDEFGRASFSQPATAPGHVRRHSGTPITPSASSTSILYPHAQPRHTGPGPAVKPTLNAQGQRTCRQCGQPGRYKEGKCVEKWGPGPAGPGTVCDRCRKKMKRVERRGTQDAATMAQHLPLVPLASNQPALQQVSPGQYYSPTHGQLPRDGQQYGPGESAQQAPQREFQFQTPLSASSTTWTRNPNRDWDARQGPRSASVVATSPTSASKPPQVPPAKPPKEKRRAPSYSESSASPPPQQEDEARSAKSTSQPNSNEGDPTTHSVRTVSRKNSGETVPSEGERIAEELLSPPGTTVKEKDGEDDADGDGDLEDAVGEEEDADADAPGESDHDQHAARKPSTRPPPLAPTPGSGGSSNSPSAVREKESNLKPSWVKLEEDGVLVA
ncbi:hypothetical protein FRB99_006864 [Tulasnella sp. 403]|nr:hypothetical protein FRB99_006864 [Tulasnella sp. 403]